MLYGGALLLLESLAGCGGTALYMGGAEPLLGLLGGRAQGLPRYLEKDKAGVENNELPT